jgi:hypothetical protein
MIDVPWIVRVATIASCLVLSTTAGLEASEWYVAVDGKGTGTREAPFGRIQDALAVAQPGDTIHVSPGTYEESLRTVRGGSPDRPIVVRASSARGSVLVTASGRVLTVRHPYHIFEGLVLDGQYGMDDIVRAGDEADGLVLRDCEIRRTSRDGIDLGAPADVLIENSIVHHALNAANGRTDAHGIVAGGVRRLTIRNTEVHTFSGDAFQVDPDRESPGWDDITIDGCRFWLRPLPAAANGFPAGVVPGENAVDTKAARSGHRPRIVIRNTTAYGFRKGLIPNMAAFNLKEEIDAVIDAVTVHSSEIGFRLRAPAAVRIQNAVIHDVEYAVRYEDDIETVTVWNSTFGGGIGHHFFAAESPRTVLDVRNVAVLGDRLPSGISDRSNLALGADAFVNAAAHDYRLKPSSPAIDRGIVLERVDRDRQGVKRPQGKAHDIGAYEHPAGDGNGRQPPVSFTEGWRSRHAARPAR